MKNILLELLPRQPKAGEVTFIVADGHGGSGKSIPANYWHRNFEPKSYTLMILQVGIIH